MSSNALLSSKVVVYEEEPSSRTISAASTSVAAMVGIAERGPIGVATLVSSWDEYSKQFGGFVANGDLPLAAKGFFENGGTELYVVRICHYATNSPTAVKGTITINDGATPSVAALTVTGKTPGAYANGVSVIVRAASGGDATLFDLVVSDDGVIAETWTNLSMVATNSRYVETIINSESGGSDLISADALTAVRPVNGTYTLTGGNDGLTTIDDSDFVGTSANKSGLYALDAVQDLALLAVPGRGTSAVHAAMIAYCETTRGDSVFAVLDPPASQSATDIVTYVSTTASLEGSSEFGAIYWPRVKILNPAKNVFGSATQITVAPSGHILGVFARTDDSQPGGVYIPPAGIEAGKLNGVVGFETTECLQESKRDLVYPHRINPLTTASGLPRYIDGARTLKGTGNFPYVPSRRGVIFIEQSLKTGLQFARHKNNNSTLRAQVKRTITAFLLNQMRNGAFASTEPDKAFFVDVSETLNTPSVVKSGKLKARVGLAMNTPAEFIELYLSQDTRALDEELAAAGG